MDKLFRYIKEHGIASLIPAPLKQEFHFVIGAREKGIPVYLKRDRPLCNRLVFRANSQSVDVLRNEGYQFVSARFVNCSFEFNL